MSAPRLRIGQMLVGADLVSQVQLERALEVQGISGVRIGTLLLERGAVSEEDLGKTLALQHACEHVPWSVLGAVPPETAALLPARLAMKYAAIPYQRGENFVKIALRDPSDIGVLDELFFVVGKRILAGAAPEVRIYQALEKYYGQLRTPRFALLAEKLSRPRTQAAPPATEPAPAPPPEFFSDVRPAASAPAPSKGNPSDLWKIPDRPAPSWRRLAPTPESLSRPEDPVSIPWEDSTGVRSRRKANPSSVPFPASDAPRFPEVLAATERDQIAASVLSALSRRFARAALLRCGSQSVRGWSAAGDRVDAAALGAVDIPWAEPSLFGDLRSSRRFHSGPLPRVPAHEPLASALGGWPVECVVWPVMIREKPAAFLYAEPAGDMRAAPEDLTFLRDLAEAAASALETAIRLKRKEI